MLATVAAIHVLFLVLLQSAEQHAARPLAAHLADAASDQDLVPLLAYTNLCLSQGGRDAAVSRGP